MTDRILMTGSDGGENYLVVARNGNVGLGLRPLAFNDYHNGGKLTVILRIRAAAFPGEEATEAEVMAAFPDFPFENNPKENSSAPRSSVYCAIRTNQTSRLFLAAALEKQRFTSKVASFLAQYAPGADYLYPDFLSFSEALNEHIGAEIVVKYKASEIAKASPEFANMAELAGKQYQEAVLALQKEFTDTLNAQAEGFLASHPEYTGGSGEDEDESAVFDLASKLAKIQEAEESYGSLDLETDGA